jgi:hypothetical protein
MCRPCLYTAHVYRDDVTLNLGRYYIYGPTLFMAKTGSCIQKRTRPMPAGQLGQKKLDPKSCVHVYWGSTLLSDQAHSFTSNAQALISLL